MLLQARIAGDAPVVGKHPRDLARIKIGRGLLRHLPAAIVWQRRDMQRDIVTAERLNAEAQPRRIFRLATLNKPP